jgi:MoxR-like ATPase
MQRINQSTAGFYHSTPLISTEVNEGGSGTTTIEVGIREMLLLCAMSGLNVILTGRTRGGKTMLARAVMEGMFGDNFGFMQIDASLDESKFKDILFGRIKKGLNLSEAVEPSKLLTAPGVIFDEFNRAPEVIVNKLQNWLTNGMLTFEGGKEVFPGVMVDGQKYQWKIATINEGSAYTGTSLIDKATRGRFSVQIPMDVFMPTEEDRRNIIESGPFTVALGAESKKQDSSKLKKLRRLEEKLLGASHRRADAAKNNSGSLQDALFELNKEVKQVPIRGDATEFLLYLLKKDHCYRSPTGTKLGFENFTTEKCKGCNAWALGNGICGSVFAPTEGTISELKRLASAFAIYRNYVAPDTKIEVGIGDAIAVAPFVLYKKMDIADTWVEKNGSGSGWEATNTAVKTMYQNFRNGTTELSAIYEKSAKGEELTEEDKKQIISIVRKDPAIGTLEDVKEVRKTNKIKR